MQRTFVTAFAGLTLALGSAFGQSAPNDEAVQRAVDAYKSVDPKAKPEEREAAAGKALEALKASDLTLAQIEKFAPIAQASPAAIRETFDARLVNLAGATTADGAAAAALRLMVIPRAIGKPSAEILRQRRETLAAAASHAALADAFKAGRAEAVLGYAGGAMNAEFAGAGIYRTLAPMITADLPSSFAATAGGFFGAASSEGSGLDKAACDTLRKSTTALLDKASADTKLDERTRKFCADSKKRINGAAARGELLDHPAPPISFLWSSAGAPPRSFADFKGKVVVVDFWATWCGPCIASFPHLREMQARYKDSSVVILGVTSPQGAVTYPKEKDAAKRKVETKEIKDELALMPAWIKDMEMTWTVAVSEDNCFNPEFGVRGIPHLAIIDAKGVVRVNGINPLSKGSPEKIVEHVDAFLREANLPVPAAAPTAHDEKKGEGGGH